MSEKRPEYQKRQHKVILLQDNAPSHTAKTVKETIEAFSWEILSHAAYSPDLAPSDYCLFASMGHALSDQRFTSYENVRKCLDDWFASKERQFFGVASTNCSRTDCRSKIINIKPHIEHCQITVLNIEDISFIPLRISNSYIAIPANPIQIDTICQTKHTLQKLDKPSITRANTSCDILYKDEHMRIGEAKNEVKYEIKTKNLALKTNDSFIHLLEKLERAPKIIDNLQGYKTTIDKIGDEIETLNFEHRIKNSIGN